MASMMADLDKATELLETLFIDPYWDTTSVKGLVELVSEILHTCIRNAIKKITEKGHTEEVAEKAILTSGPYHNTEGNIESNIAERALLSLESNKKDDDSSSYAFQDLNKLVDYMIFEMLTAVREIKPTPTVHEAIWSLLLCDLNVREASKVELELPEKGTSAKPEIGTGSQSGSKNPETIAEKCGERCNCRTLTAVANSRRNAAHRPTTTLPIEKSYKGRKRGLAKKYGCLKGNLALNDKLHSCPLSSSSSSSSSSEHNKNTSLPVKLTEKIAPKPEVPAKTGDEYLKSIPRDEKGEYIPQNDKEEMMLDIVAQKQELQKELKRWDDWTNTKVMQVTKRMTQIRQEMKKLKAEKEGANELELVNEAVEEHKEKRLSETTRALTTANAELKAGTSAIFELQTEKSAIREELEAEKKRSLKESKKLSEAFIREDEAFKKSQSFGREKTSLEEELKLVRRQVGPKQRELEKANVSSQKRRVVKEEQETAKVVNEAESIKKEKEHVEALAMAECEKLKEEAEEELKKYETKKKRIEYEISAFKLEAENKRIAAMQKSMNMDLDSSKRLEVFRNMGLKQKNDRECVMCLHEEVTVVFVPCCHQVLCEGCNVTHEKEFNVCPSCMTPIQKRISARFSKSGKLDG